MSVKKFTIFILLSCFIYNMACTGLIVYSSMPKNISAVSVKKVSSNTIVNHSSFIQISAQKVFQLCYQTYTSICKDLMLLASSAKMTFIEKAKNNISLLSYLQDITLIKNEKIRKNDTKEYFFQSSNLSENNMFNTVIFVVSMFILFLLALYKGSVPSFVDYKKYKNIHDVL